MMGIHRIEETSIYQHLAADPGANCRSARLRASKFEGGPKSDIRDY